MGLFFAGIAYKTAMWAIFSIHKDLRFVLVSNPRKVSPEEAYCIAGIIQDALAKDKPTIH